jgi:hypothetical protein
MATSIEEVKGFLDEYDLRYMAHESEGVILIGFGCKREQTTYRDDDGDAHLKLIIEVGENGEFVRVFAPFAWRLAGCIHKAAVLGVLPALQARYKMLRFDYDPDDGELQANVELPLEDASLTSSQFHRAVHAVLHGTQHFDPVIRRAMQTGEVALEMLDEKRRGRMERRIDALAAEAGGPDELEQAIAGSGPAVDDEEARAIFERLFDIGNGDGGAGDRGVHGPQGGADGHAGDGADDEADDGDARKAG